MSAPHTDTAFVQPPIKEELTPVEPSNEELGLATLPKEASEPAELADEESNLATQGSHASSAEWRVGLVVYLGYLAIPLVVLITELIRGWRP